MTKVQAPAVGTVLAGKYRLDRRVGEGGMAVVYEARHLLLESQVAIKVLTDREPITVTRFLNEARAAARIRSDFVVQVSDVGSDDGTPFMVMELLDGEDLGRMLHRRGALPCDEAVDYMLQALAGLSEAHSLGIVHRDLKPGNLFVTWRGGQPDRVKILDFGISKRLFDDGGPKVTTANSVLGSPAYMAPEQLRGNAAIDGRTDIWSAGVILYELLTGELPFSGPNAGAVFAAILENDPTPPAMLRPDLPVGIDEVVLKCLARKPADRYTTVAELAEALAPFASPVGQQTLDFLRRKVPGFRVSLVDGLEAAAPSKTGGIGTTPDVLVQSVPPRSVRRPSADLVEKHTEKPPRGGLFWSAAIAVALVAGAGVGLGLKRDKNATGPPPPAAPSSMPTVAPASGMPAASQAASAALASASASASLASASTYAAIASAGTSAASPPVVPVTVSTRPRPSPSKGKPTKVIDDEAIFQRH